MCITQITSAMRRMSRSADAARVTVKKQAVQPLKRNKIASGNGAPFLRGGFFAHNFKKEEFRAEN